MTINDIRQKYLDFMRANGHVIVPSSPLIPENDPTTLFTGSGMQPIITYLLGEPHPQGTRIADSQKCFRAEDIEEVGDNRHTTFFEMLGNWSFGDYWKQNQLTWFFTFLTDHLNIDPTKLYVSVFAGDDQNHIPQDDEAVKIWQDLFAAKGINASAVHLGSEAEASASGMQHGRIFYYEAKKNWWSRAGVPSNMPAGEPGGPDSEVFYEFSHIEHDPKFGQHCHPNCDCGRFLEIGNSVFMAYKKQEDGSFVDLPKKNIDFGGGLERIAAAANDNPDVFSLDLFQGIINTIETFTGASYQNAKQQAAIRVIADHLRAATFLIADGVVPSNKTQGYFLRRLIRRAAVKSWQLQAGLTPVPGFQEIMETVLTYYDGRYFNRADISPTKDQLISKELAQFGKSLDRGLKQFEKVEPEQVNGEFAFDLFQTYGFPFEVTEELAQQKGITLKKADFDQAREKHAQQSRTASSGMFKGGLENHSETTTKYHTATHLLHQALRDVLGDHVQQMGSNITSERLRFDFKHPDKLTDEQIQQVEALINQKIQEDLPVHKTIESRDAALTSGALAFFQDKYADQVSVYTIGRDPEQDWYSKELCGGPHVTSTGQIGAVTIIKEKAVGAGVRRIYIQLQTE